MIINYLIVLISEQNDDNPNTTNSCKIKTNMTKIQEDIREKTVINTQLSNQYFPYSDPYMYVSMLPTLLEKDKNSAKIEGKTSSKIENK